MMSINDERYLDNTGWLDSPSFLDSHDFKAYAQKILSIISNAPHALCTRDIHTALGADANYYWTMDAIESLKAIEIIYGVVDRWRPRDSNLPCVPSGKWTDGKQHEFLFAGSGVPRTPTPDLGVSR